MAKTYKCLELNADGSHIVCIKHLDDKEYPFWLYKVLDGGMHRRLIAKYADLCSILRFMYELHLFGMDSAPVSEILAWKTMNI